MTHRAQTPKAQLGAQLHPAVHCSESLPAGDAAASDGAVGCKAGGPFRRERRGFILSACTHCLPNAPRCSAHKGRCKAPLADTSPQAQSSWSFSMLGSIPAPLVPILQFVLSSHSIRPPPTSPQLPVCPSFTPLIPIAPCTLAPRCPSLLSHHPKIPARPRRSQSPFLRHAQNQICFQRSGGEVETYLCVQLPLPACSSKPPQHPSIPPPAETHSVLLHRLQRLWESRAVSNEEGIYGRICFICFWKKLIKQ